MIRHRALINGIEVEAVYTEQAVNGIFLPLLKKLTAMQEEKGSRLVVMLAAPPGAGKSTLLSFLARLSRERDSARSRRSGWTASTGGRNTCSSILCIGKDGRFPWWRSKVRR